MKKGIFLFLHFISTASLSAQHYIFTVDKPQEVYAGIPNTIDFAFKENVDGEIKLIAEYGKVFKKDQQLYWIPQSPKDRLFVALDKTVIDTIKTKVFIIKPDKFDFIIVKPDLSGVISHPFKQFEEVRLVKPDEYSHLSLDTIVKIESYDFIVQDTATLTIDSIHYESNFSELEKANFLGMVRNIYPDSYLELKNIKLSCKCWSSTNELKYAYSKKVIQRWTW